MSEVLKTVLLLALPASGKSEVRRFLEHQDEATCKKYFHMGPTVQLDDYPYVHLMRCIDDICPDAGINRIFFQAADKGFKSPLDWLTLIALINKDYEDLMNLTKRKPENSVEWLFDRYDKARAAVNADTIFNKLSPSTKAVFLDKLQKESDLLVSDWNMALPDTLHGKTVVIEFARGGADTGSMPLPTGFGYQNSLRALSKEILEDASILYVWVTPEQSRAKNRERARPGADGSILFHGVPTHVMVNDYGCDDMEYLLEQSDKEGAVKVERDAKAFYLPAARFDNRQDLTTFVRKDVEAWNTKEATELRDAISGAMKIVWKASQSR